MPWLLLIIAGLLEIGFALAMKSSQGFTRLIPSLLTVGSGLSSVVLLSIALRSLPVGTGYAVWTAIFGMVMLGDPASGPRLLCIGLILGGVVGLKFVA
jgi:quaternary ammonium compound-resistance protein SugE